MACSWGFAQTVSVQWSAFELQVFAPMALHFPWRLAWPPFLEALDFLELLVILELLKALDYLEFLAEPWIATVLKQKLLP